MTKSVYDPDTHFYLPHYPETRPPCDLWEGEPTGEVVCESCYEAAMHVAEIDHADGCPQADVEF